MIVTVTLNPSLDRTIDLPGELLRGAVNRATGIADQPGGKGINVAGAIRNSGLTVAAVLTAHQSDPFLDALSATTLPFSAIPVGGQVRTNITVAEPDGTTTKLNAPGTPLTDREVDTVTAAVLAAADDADWVALCGSLPPGAPPDWYARLTAALTERGIRVAADTSGAPLRSVAHTCVDLLKPNADELAELTGGDGRRIERQVADGDTTTAAAASHTLATHTGGQVLTTLGGAGAILASPDSVWYASAPPVAVRSTVGAGDSALAGYLIAAARGDDNETRLRTAVAYGTAAATLPGTTPPQPHHLDLRSVTVVRLS